MNVVWFKRDLRIHDNAALTEAAKNGPVMPLYILEPDLWQQSDLSHRQYQFLCECLNELNKALTNLGQRLIIKVGEAVDVLQKIHENTPIQALWSHQETWNGWTFERDKRVKAWAKESSIPWHEPLQYGVIRRLKDRDSWANFWYQFIKSPVHKAPEKLNPINEVLDHTPTAEELGLEFDGCTLRQKGGRYEGVQLLKSFLTERGENYTKAMSSPVTAFDSCSRLSPHIAFGTLSIREVFYALERKKHAIENAPPYVRGYWLSAFKSFEARLRWHCHFIQKLEDEPAIEYANFHPMYNDLRPLKDEENLLEAWKSGNTGYPMIDACMRALITTGWINFRMRAMLMSFATYHLWLHWREPALHLARLFTDYEPGIHYSQAQMQSGTTGINSLRIYNPIKQGIEQDPTGDFIRKWVPELKGMDTRYIHTPWENPADMNNYPMPVVDEKKARQFAAKQLYELRKNSFHKTEADRIVKKHSSRKRPTSHIKKRGLEKHEKPQEKNKVNKQRELPL